MAASNPKTHLKCGSKLSTFEAIKCDISPENLPSLGKESLKQHCKELRLKVTGEKQELVERLAPLGKSAELFQKKVLRISQTYKFSTSLEASEVPPPSANWKIIGRNEDSNVPVVNENTIRDYQKAKYAGKKGQYRKAHLMFSSRRITSVKMMESNSKRSFVKANVLKSYTGSISRPVTIMFVGNTPTQAYCPCAVGKSGLCCHAIALLMQLNYFREHKKLFLHMTCTEKLQKWHLKGPACNRTIKSASQIKLKYLRNLRGARRDIKKRRKKKKIVEQNKERSDFSDWYKRDVIEIERKIMENIAKKKSVENHVYSVLSRYKKKSGLFLHLRYKTEYERREKGRDHDKEVLKPRFQAGTESIWRPQISTESKDDSCSSSPSDQSFQNEKIIIPLLKKQNYLEVEQCSNEWRALRVGTITASKVPSLLGFNGVKEFDNGWFTIKNRIDEHVLNPKRSKLPNFIRGKQQEQNAIQQFQNDSKMGVSQCGYFKHPSDSRFGASPDGVSTGRQQFLVEIKTRSLPYNTQLEKLNEEEKNKKMEIALKPLPHITGAHLCQCHLQMECTQTDLTYLMSYVPETKVATYFPVQKNHILCEIMMEILIHIYENKSFQDPWAHFEHPHLKKLGNQLVGSVPSFENTRHFRSWVNSVAKSTPCISF